MKKKNITFIFTNTNTIYVYKNRYEEHTISFKTFVWAFKIVVDS